MSPFLGCWSGCRLSAVCCALAGDDVIKNKMVLQTFFLQMHSQIFLCHTRKVGSFKGSISSKSDPYRQCISRLSRYGKSTYSTFLTCLYTYIYYIISYLFSKCLFRLLLDNSQFSLCSKLQTSNCSYKFLPVPYKDLFWFLVKMVFDSLAKTKSEGPGIC